MKLNVMCAGCEITVEEIDGKAIVMAMKDGELVEEFTVDCEETEDDAEEDMEDEMEDDAEEAEEDMEDDMEDDVNESVKNFGDFMKVKK